MIIYRLMGPQGALDHIVSMLVANKRTPRAFFLFAGILHKGI